MKIRSRIGWFRWFGSALALFKEALGLWIGSRWRFVVEIDALGQMPKGKSQQRMAEQNRKIVDHRNAALSGIPPQTKSNRKIASWVRLSRYS
jgi:hypothetical protein